MKTNIMEAALQLGKECIGIFTSYENYTKAVHELADDPVCDAILDTIINSTELSDREKVEELYKLHEAKAKDKKENGDDIRKHQKATSEVILAFATGGISLAVKAAKALGEKASEKEPAERKPFKLLGGKNKSVQEEAEAEEE